MAAPTVFGTTKEGQPVNQWELSNGPLSIKVIDFGATITSVLAPDANGTPSEITLGFEELAPYTDGRSPYFGCVAGRVANRIAKGKFTLDGTTYSLATNNGPSAAAKLNPHPDPLSTSTRPPRPHISTPILSPPRSPRTISRPSDAQTTCTAAWSASTSRSGLWRRGARPRSRSRCSARTAPRGTRAP